MKKGVVVIICLFILGAGLSYGQIKMKLTPTSQLLKPVFDIAVIDIYVDQNCILWVKFENKGKTDIDTKLHFKLWINDALVRDEDMLFDKFEAGKWRAHGYTGVKPIVISGTVRVKAFVDSNNNMIETDEINNQLVKTLSCQPVYDIAVIDIYVDQNCILWIKFENKGKTKINTTLHFKLWINDALVRDENMLFDEFEAGKWRAHGYTGVKPIRILRASQIKAFVDTLDQLKEVDEVNNTLTKKLPACQLLGSVLDF